MAKVRKSGVVIVGVVLVVAAVGYFFVDQALRDKARAAVAPSGPAGIPVTVAVAEARDVPIYIRGLGTVQAYKTVAVKTQVDGQIVKVDFREGQDVKEGDLLFQIDPRPLPGGARSRGRHQAARRGAARGRPARSRALRQADRSGLPVAPELRPAEGDGRRAQGRARRRPGGDRHRQAQPRLCRRSARRSTAAPASGWSTSATWCRPARTDAGDDHPDQADLRELHRAAVRQPAICARARRRKR